MSSKSVTIRMDENLKKQAESLFEDMGLNMTTAITLFAKAAVKQNKIPFEIVGDPFWSEAHQKNLNKVITEYETGNAHLITKTMDELEAMANE